MINAKWYLVCDIKKKEAIDLTQITETWGNATGLLEQSDTDLEYFYLWSSHPTISFMSVERAVEYGISQISIDAVLTVTRPAVLAWLRQMRDPVLQASDAITVTDRWNTLDVVDQNYVKQYRQALRDITDALDPFNVTWPTIPLALNSLRGVDLSLINRPSEGFMAMLTGKYPEPTLEERRSNQRLRIKALRDQRKAGGVKVTVEGKDYWFWTDDSSRGQYSILDGLATRKGLPDEYVLEPEWKTMSGEYVAFTVGLLRQVIEAGITNEMAVFAVAKNYQDSVTTLEVPESIDYHVGWPESYDDYVANLLQPTNG